MTAGAPPPPESFGMLVLRIWMWAVPVVMFVAAVFFGVIAAIDERWALLVMMVFMALIALGLFTLHWWVIRGMGGARSKEQGTR